MSAKKKKDKKIAKPEPYRRPHYFAGENLTAEDLQQEQQYMKPKPRKKKPKPGKKPK